MIRAAAALATLLLVGAAPDWTRTVTATPTGAYVLGNPAAKVRLVEYLSYTCPHCAHFTKDAATPLKANYVRSGKVAVEFRHAIRDGLDLSAALLTRCGAAGGFFTRSEAVFANQGAMFEAVEKWQAANPAPANMDAAVKAFAQGSGLGTLMARHGVAPARQAQCLADPKMRATLIAQTKEAWETRKIGGVPYFLVNGTPADGNDWPRINAALRTKVK